MGALLFRLIIQTAKIDTRATASHIREKLTNLQAYIAVVNSNIDSLNKNVKVNVEGLKLRGESTYD